MGRYLGKRLISTIPLLLVISFVVFMFIHMIPGDPARLVAGHDSAFHLGNFLLLRRSKRQYKKLKCEEKKGNFTFLDEVLMISPR